MLQGPPTMTAPPTSLGAPPRQPGAPTPGAYSNQLPNQFGNMNLNNQMNSQASQPIAIMQTKDPPIGPEKYQPPNIKYQVSAPPGISRIPPNRANCDREVMCSTLNAIPVSDSLCQKAK